MAAEEWNVAERGAHEILYLVQPTVISERKRKEVIEYIQILIGSSYGIKVFPFGSVPLKTYLPDGDIDLTVVCSYDEEYVLSILYNLLKNEEMMNTNIQVRNVECVPAQVKVLRCSAEKICVDISFNNMAGLCALSFLEQVDQQFGNEHLFKRSVILIKSWCYYESRILGSHCGLISTYAVETMVIHIINLFRSALYSPLAVLHKFVTYYEKFDWDNYCVAIDGMMLRSSLPEVVVQLPEGCDEPILSAEFLQQCKESYSVSTGLNQTGRDQFHTKFINIVDPLNNYNNLGRSVNKASFSRIKFSFSYASEKLEAIFALPLDKVMDGIRNFFKTTLQQNGRLFEASGSSDGTILEQNGTTFEASGSSSDGTILEQNGTTFEASGSSDENENLLAGLEYGLWSHDYGMNQGDGCDVMYPQTSSPVAKMAAATAQKSKSRGTGTYIPQPVHVAEWYSARSRRRPDFHRPSRPMLQDEGFSRTDGSKFLWTAKDGNNNSVKLSTMELPPLPPTTQTNQQIDRELDPTSPIFPTASTDPPLPVEGKEENEESSENKLNCKTLVEDVKDESHEGQLNLEDPSEIPELPLLRLQDPTEFPELPLLRLRDPIEFPDLPTLRLRDPKDFPPLPTKQQKGKGIVGRKGRKKE